MSTTHLKTDETNQTFKTALKFEIELPTGETSQIITIFNSFEVNFEALVRQTHCALAEKTNRNIKSVVTSLGSLKDGYFQEVALYNKIIF